MIAQSSFVEHTRKPGSRVSVIAALGVVLAALWTASPAGLQVEARSSLAALFLWRGPLPGPENVVIIAMNPVSAKRLNLPERPGDWPRHIYAQALEQLTHLQAAAIGLDVFFAQARHPEQDTALAEALANAPNTVLFARLTREYLPSPHRGTLDQVQQPYALLAEAATATAPFYLSRYPDQVAFFPLTVVAQDSIPTLPLALLQRTHPEQASNLSHSESAWFNFYGPPRTLQTIEMADFLQEPEAFRAQIAGATVFIGYSAAYQAQQQDEFRSVFSTPEGLDISGVELAATAYANLRDQSQLRVPAAGIRAAWIVLAGILLGLALCCVKRYFWLLGLGFSLLTCLLSGWAFSQWQLFLPTATLLGALYPGLTALAYLVRLQSIHREQAILEQALGRYLPRTEIKTIAKQRGNLPRGSRMHAICLVTDIRDYTRLAERMDVDALAALMSAYYEALITSLKAHGAMISDVTGDGLIALWPLTPEQALPDVVAAMNTLDQALADFAAAHPQTPLPTGSALHYGEVVLGHFGAADAYEYRALGDLINTTTRLEGLNRTMQTRRLWSAAVLDVLAIDKSRQQYHGELQLKGRQQSVAVYSLMP